MHCSLVLARAESNKAIKLQIAVRRTCLSSGCELDQVGLCTVVQLQRSLLAVELNEKPNRDVCTGLRLTIGSSVLSLLTRCNDQ